MQYNHNYIIYFADSTNKNIPHERVKKRRSKLVQFEQKGSCKSVWALAGGGSRQCAGGGMKSGFHLTMPG